MKGGLAMRLQIVRRWGVIGALLILASVSCLNGTGQADESGTQAKQHGLPVPESFLVVGKTISDTVILRVEFVAISGGLVIGDSRYERFTTESFDLNRRQVWPCWNDAKIGEPLPNSCR